MEFEKLQEIIADVLNVDPNEVTMETTFTDDLGADSLDVFQIVMGIEEEFDIQIEAEEAEHIVSVEDAVEAIKRNWQNNRKWRRAVCYRTALVRPQTPANGTMRRTGLKQVMNNIDKLVDLEKKIQYKFQNFGLLEMAMRHSS